MSSPYDILWESLGCEYLEMCHIQLLHQIKSDHEYFLHRAQMFLLFLANDGGGKNSIQTS